MVNNRIAGLIFITLYFVTYSDALAVMSVDLGSEFLKIAIVKPGVPMEIALNIESRRKTPVVVSMKDNERLFSDPAMNVAVKYPKNAYRYFQDLIGKKYDNPLVTVYKDRFPHYEIIKDERGSIAFQHDSATTFTIEELLGMVLNNSREIAERFADQPIKDLIITVPSFFTQAERRAIQRSAEMVGLNVLQLMNDNTAAALNFGVFRYTSFNATEKIHMFYDMGATSTTATIVGYSTTKVKDRGIVETAPQLVVKGVGFDRTLGGREFDFRLRDHLVKLFTSKHKDEDPTTSPRSMSKFLKEAQRVKQVLSANTETISQIEGAYKEFDFRAKVTRAEFEELCEDLFARVADPVKQALKSSSVTLDEIQSVLVIGGGFRIPKVQDILLDVVKKSELSKNINADEAAALGAVYQAARLSKGFRVKNFIVKDANVYPVEVTFERPLKNDKGEQTGEFKKVKRTLFHRNNLVPQKKVMTFNKNTEDFDFFVSYGDISFLKDLQQSMVGTTSLLNVKVKGVAEMFKKHTTEDKTESKGIKAYFKLDESGLLHLEKIESVFEKAAEPVVEEQSTFAKLGSKITSFFTGPNEEEEGTIKENNQTEEAKPDESSKDADDKEPDSNDAKKDEEDKPKNGEKEEEPVKEDNQKEQHETKKEETEKQGKEDEKSTTAESDEKVDEKSQPEEKETKDEEKGEKKTDEKSDDEKKDKKSEDDENTNEKNKTDEKSTKSEPPKPVTIKEPLEVESTVVDLTEMSSETYETAVNRLKNLKARDEAKIAKEQAKNHLESFLFETRDKLSSEEGEEMLTEEEREKMDVVLTEISEWLDDEGWDTTADIYEEKLKKLVDTCKDFYTRLTEMKQRPVALENIRRSINLTTTFLKQVGEMKEKNEIYTEKDLKDVWVILNETVEWLTITEGKQNNTKASENPVLLVKHLTSKTAKLDRELMYLLNKAKYYVPKVKPIEKNTTNSTNETASDEGKIKKENNETKIEDDKSYSEDDVQKQSEGNKDDISQPETDKESIKETPSHPEL